MWFTGGQKASHEGIGYAYSTDGLHWTRSANNPIMHKVDGVLWRSERTYTPAVVKDGNTYKMWFSGKDDTNYAIGYATNAAPVAQYKSVTTSEDTALLITLVASDVDGDALTYAIVAQPAHGSVTLDGNVATYTPAANFNGEDSFTYKAKDAVLESELAVVTITVTPVNDWVEANDDAYETIAGVTLDVAAPGVLENDVLLDPDEEVSVQILEGPQHGDLSMNDDGSFTYIPDAGYMGTDTFRYMVLSVQTINAAEWSDDATVTITVQPLMRLFLPLVLR